MQMAALISVAHKLNYALLSCKSIPFIIARSHMLAILSEQLHTRSYHLHNRERTIPVVLFSLILCFHSLQIICFNIEKDFWYVVVCENSEGC